LDFFCAIPALPLLESDDASAHSTTPREAFCEALKLVPFLLSNPQEKLLKMPHCLNADGRTEKRYLVETAKALVETERLVSAYEIACTSC
jgi:hypothetical protein